MIPHNESKSKLFFKQSYKFFHSVSLIIVMLYWIINFQCLKPLISVILEKKAETNPPNHFSPHLFHSEVLMFYIQ